MDIYKKKQKWKYSLFGVAIIIAGISLFTTNNLVNELNESSTDLQNSADSLKNTINSLKDFTERLEEEEKENIELWANATETMVKKKGTDPVAHSFIRKIQEEEHGIPIIVIDQNATKTDIPLSKNIPEVDKILARITGDHNYARKIAVNRISKKTRDTLNNLLSSELELMKEYMNSKKISPIQVLAIVDEDTITNQKIYYKNSKHLTEAKKMHQVNQRIYRESQKMHKESENTREKLRYYPIYQLALISLFGFFAYLIFNTIRRSEQNQVWAGMAKETAHQIGTPLSSLMAWTDLLKERKELSPTIIEMEKDLQRLEKITERFSKIGSKPELQNQDVIIILKECIKYMSDRLSKKIKFNLSHNNPSIIIPLNKILFVWAIENLCKNAVDSMSGEGTISISCNIKNEEIEILVSDTGKGINKEMMETIFMPGITSKKRGWGLGLSLVKRIVEEYHKGRIFVMKSKKMEGTTFCITLKK